MRQKEASGNLHNPLCTDKKGHKGQKRKPLLATFMDCPWTVMDCRKAAAARLSGKSAEAAVEGDTKAHISSLFEISWDNLWRLSSLLPWSFFICSSWDFESRRLLIFPKLPKDCPTLVNLKPDLHDVSIFRHHAECTGQCLMLVLWKPLWILTSTALESWKLVDSLKFWFSESWTLLQRRMAATRRLQKELGDLRKAAGKSFRDIQVIFGIGFGFKSDFV